MIWIVFFLLIALVSTVIGLYHKNTNGICKSKRRLDGKTAIVTGGTSGIGLEIASDFAGRGARVIIACPFEEEGQRAQKFIREQTGNQEVFFKMLDLASLASVREFANDILKNEKRLDLLINNAGVPFGKDPPLTKDGIDFLLQVHYFGHFLLTLLLLSLLKKTGTAKCKSRIVNTASILHNIARINPKDLNKVKYFPRIPVQDYANSKTLNILFTRELSERLKAKDANVIVNAVEPGAVGSLIFLPMGKLGYFITYAFKFMGKNVWEGAQTSIYAAVDEKVDDVSGKYFKDCKAIQPSRLARNDKLAKEVWNETVRMVKISEEELRLAQV